MHFRYAWSPSGIWEASKQRRDKERVKKRIEKLKQIIQNIE